jgi:hypothetical protein
MIKLIILYIDKVLIMQMLIILTGYCLLGEPRFVNTAMLLMVYILCRMRVVGELRKRRELMII